MDPVKVHFDIAQDESRYPPTSSEYLWCTPTDRGTYIVDNIPFFVRDVSVGDEIEAHKVADTFRFDRVLHQSKNSTIRVLLKQPTETERVRTVLDELGCGTELMPEMNLVAVMMPPESQVGDVLSFLDDEADEGNIGIEESAVRYQTLH